MMPQVAVGRGFSILMRYAPGDGRLVRRPAPTDAWLELHLTHALEWNLIAHGFTLDEAERLAGGE